MKLASMIFVTVILMIPEILLFGQSTENCFLKDFEPKNAIIPPHQDFDNLQNLQRSRSQSRRPTTRRWQTMRASRY